MDSSNALETRRLTKRYGSVTAVDDLTLDVARGEIFGFLGPNGAGKTTSVKMLVGLAKPSGGDGTLLGLPLGDKRAELITRVVPSNDAICFPLSSNT